MTTHAHLPEECYDLLGPGSVLLQTLRFDGENYRSYLFREPEQVIAATCLDGIPDAFAQVEETLARGAYVAGFVSYECGEHFECTGEHSRAAGIPLVWFGVYPRAYVFDHRRGTFEGGTLEETGAGARRAGARRYDFRSGRARLEIAVDKYERSIEAIRDYIRAGDTYQVNFTDKVSFEFEGSPIAMFQALQGRQRVSYSAYIDCGDSQILSFSPELFFRVRGRTIVTRPMKGTVSRGRDAVEDAGHAEWLRKDDKNLAENVMIVDLLRNDLGKICEFGSVRVDELFALEQYETLWQMTSTISGKLRPGLTYYDIFKGLFPCGSVTGAPKVRSMEIIRELERRPRGVYTGAIGFMSPQGEAVFNVPIRTAVLQDGRGEMGVGSGIVFDSNAGDEYQECLLKAEFLTASIAEHEHTQQEQIPGFAEAKVEPGCGTLQSDASDNTSAIRFLSDAAPTGMDSDCSAGDGGGFQLIESILWDGTYPRLALHLERLEKSALHFGFSLDVNAAAARLQENQAALQPGLRYKVRLLLQRSGAVTVENHALQGSEGSARVALADVHTSSHDTFLYHKTTRRQLYDVMYRQAQERGLDDFIFVNERGEITEGAISNVFVQTGTRLYTPPVCCGLLPGVFRRHMLETNAAAEKVLRPADLQAADAIYIGNAIRGLRRVELECLLAP